MTRRSDEGALVTRTIIKQLERVAESIPTGDDRAEAPSARPVLYSTAHARLTRVASKRSELITTLRPTYDESNAELASAGPISTRSAGWRVCEPWFSPAMAGVDSAGLGVASDPKRPRMRHVSPTRISNMIITSAADVAADPWRDGTLRDDGRVCECWCYVTRAEYDEYGGERVHKLKWWGGNWN
ncbi:hypothetical protein C8R46DRAFT_1286639 [Mycena filopes]|nr:hypothetical protein C8R46DRAFT_1286639 [Mycena filopes]